MDNINTPMFWNRTNKNSLTQLLLSPVYIFKINFVSKIILRNSLKVVDVGIGNGYLEKVIHRQNKSISLSGIDIASDAVKGIRKKVKGDFRVASALNIPFKNFYFDTVVALDVLEHFGSKELAKVMNEINRIIKPNGILIVSVPLNENPRDELLNRHLYRFSEANLNNFFVKHKYIILKSKFVAAFESLFYIKNLVNSVLKLRKNNLAILVCKKI